MVNKNISKGLLLAMLFVPAMSIRADEPAPKGIDFGAWFTSAKGVALCSSKSIFAFQLGNSVLGKLGLPAVDTSVIGEFTGKVPFLNTVLCPLSRIAPVIAMASLSRTVYDNVLNGSLADSATKKAETLLKAFALSKTTT